MGDYRIWKCKNCGATVLCDMRYDGLGRDFREVSENVACCPGSNISWGNVGTVDRDDMVILTDNDVLESEPEFPRQSRVELALEDAFHE
jgi:hypothetical protein